MGTYVPPDCSSVAPAGVAPARANNLCVSTSPPPGEPGQDTLESHPSGSPELLHSLSPPAERSRRRWRVPAVPVLAALIGVVMMSSVVLAVDHGSSAEAGAGAAPPPTAPPAAKGRGLPGPPPPPPNLPP